ncbi:hypothetical protein BD626DRAFT_519077 [Schizophyllum amplum]|uniref:Uncharacterized protein n=1 Tax=Schizophyllum amplum TaxID=97359 RepID=A0A550BVH9_9AGAR|nr:hypothetical protein BD626DRAFT_519077 [Auriculariopsis ampla]
MLAPGRTLTRGVPGAVRALRALRAPTHSQSYAPAQGGPQSVRVSLRFLSVSSRSAPSDAYLTVTGGGRGLGITLAGAYLEAGADVYCVDVLPTAASHEEWDRLRAKAKDAGRALGYRQLTLGYRQLTLGYRQLTLGYRQLDIPDQARVNEVFREIAEEAPTPVRVLMAAAGIQHESDAIAYDEKDVRRVIDVNVVGTFNTVQAAARLMQQHDLGGSIAMIASMSATIANRGLTCVPYNSSKAALVQMARTLAMEWAPSIRVNTLSPGYIKTILTERLMADRPGISGRWEGDNPLGRMSLPYEYKGPAIFLASDASSFCNGFDLRCDGGHAAW